MTKNGTSPMTRYESSEKPRNSVLPEDGVKKRYKDSLVDHGRAAERLERGHQMSTCTSGPELVWGRGTVTLSSGSPERARRFSTCWRNMCTGGATPPEFDTPP